MSGISPSIEHPTPIIKDFDMAMTDFHASLERQVVVAEALSHSLWDLLDGRWFKPKADLRDIETLRERIVTIAMRSTVAAEALDHHCAISFALGDASPSAGGRS